jgi:hypothetical protein
MKAASLTLRGLIWFLIVLLMMPAGLLAQVAGESQEGDRFSKEELTQMLAPIALYPDSLTAQVLMASTYPLEIVEAERWLRQNKGLKGDALDKALQEKPWDPSVKSLCHTPDILLSLSDKLDQTRKLGDAFLSQEDEVMATIQELRRKARDQGNLQTTKEQRVVVEEEFVRIEPANPEVVYVPVYDPYYVYGPWWYPAYPPYYWYYPPGFVTGAYIGFGPAFYVGFGFYSWAWFNWPSYHIHVDVHKTRHFHRHYPRRDYPDRVWRHNPTHRKGVAYRDRRTGERYGARPPRASTSRPENRGYPDRRGERRDVRPSPAPGERRGSTVDSRERRDRTVQPREQRERDVQRGTVERRERIDTQRGRPEGQRMQSPVRRDTPFRGIGEGNFERRAGERGGMSIRGGQFRSPSGGSRGGEMRDLRGGSRGGGSGGGGSRR